MPYIQFIRSKVGAANIFLNFAGVWIENANGVLLDRRLDNDEWGLIGGAMELGESAMDAAQRECKEETGLDAKVGDLIGVYTNAQNTLPNGDQYQAVLMMYYAQVDPSLDPVASSESREVRYFPRAHLPELGFEQHRVIARDALAGRKGVSW